MKACSSTSRTSAAPSKRAVTRGGPREDRRHQDSAAAQTQEERGRVGALDDSLYGRLSRTIDRDGLAQPASPDPLDHLGKMGYDLADGEDSAALDAPETIRIGAHRRRLELEPQPRRPCDRPPPDQTWAVIVGILHPQPTLRRIGTSRKLKSSVEWSRACSLVRHDDGEEWAGALDR
jgi:hypothetical protein